MAYRTRDVRGAITAATGPSPVELRVHGGALVMELRGRMHAARAALVEPRCVDRHPTDVTSPRASFRGWGFADSREPSACERGHLGRDVLRLLRHVAVVVLVAAELLDLEHELVGEGAQR